MIDGLDHGCPIVLLTICRQAFLTPKNKPDNILFRRLGLGLGLQATHLVPCTSVTSFPTIRLGPDPRPRHDCIPRMTAGAAHEAIVETGGESAAVGRRRASSAEARFLKREGAALQRHRLCYCVVKLNRRRAAFAVQRPWRRRVPRLARSRNATRLDVCCGRGRAQRRRPASGQRLAQAISSARPALIHSGCVAIVSSLESRVLSQLRRAVRAVAENDVEWQTRHVTRP
jgi:hypothetical protein